MTDPHREISAEDRKILSKDFNLANGNNSLLFPSINVIEKINDEITAYADKRGGGDHATFWT